MRLTAVRRAAKYVGPVYQSRSDTKDCLGICFYNPDYIGAPKIFGCIYTPLAMNTNRGVCGFYGFTPGGLQGADIFINAENKVCIRDKGGNTGSSFTTGSNTLVTTYVVELGKMYRFALVRRNFDNVKHFSELWINGQFVDEVQNSGANYVTFNNMFYLFGNTFDNYFSDAYISEPFAVGGANTIANPPLLRKIQNEGRGSDLVKVSKLPIDFYLDYSTDGNILVNKGNTAAALRTEIYPYPLITYNELINRHQFLPRKVGDKIQAPVRGRQHSNLFKDLIYEGSSRVMTNYHNLVINNLTGPWGRADSTSTDMPASWAGKTVDLRGNKHGGTTSTEHAESVITNAKALNFYDFNQSPVGFSRVRYEVAANHNHIHMYSARKSFVAFTTKDLGIFTVTQVRVDSNSLDQTFAELIDFTKIKVTQFFAGNNPSLTGAIAVLSDNMNYLNLQSTGVNGTCPEMPETMRTVVLHDTQFTAPPTTFNQLSTLYFNNSKMGGIWKFKTIWDLRGSWTADVLDGGVTLDFSGLTSGDHLGYWGVSQVSKIGKVIFPLTSGATLAHFGIGGVTNLIIENFPTDGRLLFRYGNLWPGVASVFNISGSGVQDRNYFIGQTIQSQIIHIDTLGISQANVIANVDSWLDHAHTYFNIDTHKLFRIHNNADLINDTARPDRINQCIDKVKAHGYQFSAKIETVNNFYTKTFSINKSLAAVDEITVEVQGLHFYHSGNSTSVKLLRLPNNPTLEGDWTFVRQQDNADGTGPQSSYARFWVLQRVGFDNTLAVFTQEQGVINQILT
jgi:hypothetical protein